MREDVNDFVQKMQVVQKMLHSSRLTGDAVYCPTSVSHHFRIFRKNCIFTRGVSSHVALKLLSEGLIQQRKEIFDNFQLRKSKQTHSDQKFFF